MEKATKSSNKWSKPVAKWMRIIHRYLGYLMVGICLVYGISGFLLNHMNGQDPAFKTQEGIIQIGEGLSADQSNWEATGLPEIKKILPADEVYSRLMLNSGVAIYNINTGEVDYETYKKNNFVYWINKLHYNKVNGWSIMGDLFAFSLIFFAISGVLMVRGKHSVLRRGKWFLLIGILIPILYILLA